MNLTPTQTYWSNRPVLYRMFDADRRLIYVGASKNLPQRLVSHRAETWWLSLVARTRIQVFPTMAAAFAAESVAIQEEQPVFNRMHTGREHYDFSHWTLDDFRACKEWQAVNGRRWDLPPAARQWWKERSA